MIKRKLTGMGLIVAVCLGLIAPNLSAEAPMNLAQVYFVTAKDGQMDTLYAKIQEHAEWRKAAGDPWVWHVFTVENGEDMGQVVIRSGNHSWACWDAYAEFGEKGTAEWNKNVVPHIAKISSMIMRNHDIIHDWPEDPAEASLLRITWHQLKPGMQTEFFEAASVYHKTIQENDRDVHYSFGSVVSGGPGDRVVMALPYANYAAMAGPDEKMGDFMKRILGEDKAEEARDNWNNAVAYSTSYIIRFHPEMSVLPDPEK